MRPLRAIIVKRIPLPDVAISRDQVVVILMAFDGNGIGRYLWGSCSVANCHRQIGLYAEFIPETFFEEGLKGQGASLYNQRLDAMGMKAVEIQGMLMVDNQPLGIRATPLSDIQLRVVALVCDSSHQNGVLLSTKFMGEHLGEVRGDLRGLEMVIDKSVGRLRPFQDDIRPMLSMECEETAVQGLTLCSHTPTSTSMPASWSFLMPRPCTSANSSMQPTTTRLILFLMIKSAQGGVLP